MTFHVKQKLLFDHSKCLSSKKEATVAEKSTCLNQPADIDLMAMVIIVVGRQHKNIAGGGHHLWMLKQYLIYFPLSGIVDKCVTHVNSNAIFLLSLL